MAWCSRSRMSSTGKVPSISVSLALKRSTRYWASSSFSSSVSSSRSEVSFCRSSKAKGTNSRYDTFPSWSWSTWNMMVLISRLVKPSSMDVKAEMNSCLLSCPLPSVSMRSKMEPTRSVSSSRDMPCTKRSSACCSTSEMCWSMRFFAYMPWMICSASGMNSSYSIWPSAFMSASAKNLKISSLGKSRRTWRSSMRVLNSFGSRNPLLSLSYLPNKSWMMASTSSMDMSGSSPPGPATPWASAGRPLARQSKYFAANSLMLAGWFRSTSRAKSFKMSGNSGGMENCFAKRLDMAGACVALLLLGHKAAFKEEDQLCSPGGAPL
mmetsp:Transcript_95612/g.243013  ORF Transcript_95612/g.243013 Transcript_95612/m.243013 type:complete len:323 (-) Transcript_95612:55-1023(-)